MIPEGWGTEIPTTFAHVDLRSVEQLPLPPGVSSHHTAWVTPPAGSAHPVRYAVDGERLVCFGDGFLAEVEDHARVSVSIHEIAGAGGHLLASFSASLRELAAEEVGAEALIELLEHVALGRTLGEVEVNLDHHGAPRRIVELSP